MKRVLILTVATLLSFSAYAQERSDRLKPQWLKDTPTSKVGGIYYIPVSVYSTDVNSIFTLSLNELTRHIARDWNVKTSDNVTRTSNTVRSGNDIVSNQREQSYMLRVEAEGKPVDIQCKVVDSYWENETIGGSKQKKASVLYQVASPQGNLDDEYAYTTTKYGASALFRSIIPGWGQWYKGQKVRGSLFFLSEAAAVAGIVVCENLRSSYMTKAQQQPKYVKEYLNKANNFQNGRNIAIGVAAGIWIYNLIDAVVAPGARRVVLSPKFKNFNIRPMAGIDNAGLSFGYNF
jgi:hypothetical protein